MKKSIAVRWTATFGIVMYLFVLAEIPLYFVYTPTAAGTPPVPVILNRILLDLFICMGLIGFFSGFKQVIAETAPRFEWMGHFIFGCGLVFATVAFVADSIQAGATWAAGSDPINPTFVGFGAEGALLIYGPINRLLSVAILVAGSWLILKAGLFPRWTAWLGFLAALYNAAFIPTLYTMTTPLDFYSTNGWNIPMAAGVFFLWIFILSILLIMKKKQ